MKQELFVIIVSALFLLTSIAICYLAIVCSDLIERIKIIEKELKDHERKM